MSLYFHLLSLLLISGLPACAGKLSSIPSVQIEDEVSKPGHFIYYGTTDVVMGALFGLGAVMGGMGPDKEGAEIEARLRSAGFKVDQQALGDLKRELSKRGVFGNGGSYKLRLDITRYGMGVAPTGFKRLKPVLEGQITIRDGAFKQVYFLRRAVSDTDDVVRGQTYEEYKANIQLLVRDMKALSAKLAERLAETLEKDRKGASSTPPSGSSGEKASSRRFSR